jgi:hypothetical protein
MDPIGVIVSTTTVPLWRNPIPNRLYDTLMTKLNIRTKEEIRETNRHNKILIETFQEVYGQYLEYCSYATIKEMPFVFKNFYKIIQVECFANSLYPESIELQVDECLSFYKNSHLRDEIRHYILRNTNDCRYCIIYKGHLIT